MIYKNNGISKIVQLLKSDKLESKSIKEKMCLKKIVFGCLLNVLNDKPEYQEIALENDLISLMVDALGMETSKLNQDSVVFNCVLVLFCILDNESSMDSLKNFKLISNLIEQLNNLNLKQIKSVEEMNELDLETVESIIDLLMQISNSDNELKLKLVDKGIIEILIEILDHELIEEEQILKTSSNLVVTLVSDEQTARKYYNNGKGMAYLKAKQWLNTCIEQFEENNKSTDDEISVEKENLTKQNQSDLIEKDDFIREKAKPKDLNKTNTQLITSALMIGNFSGNNDDAIAICKDGLIDKLVKVVELNEDFTIQFACLSTLRNLAIADHNKRHFVVNGLLTRLLRLNYSESPSVVFKYLATLRLITDKQPEAAFEIINNHKLIDNLKTWANLDSLTGVKAEASRLLANLFKNLDNRSFNYEHLMNRQLLKSMFEMMRSEHLKMQNEAVNGIGFLINKFERNSIVNDLLTETFLTNIPNLIRTYSRGELNEFELKFVQNVLSVLSFGCLKYQLEPNNELCELIENLNHPNLSTNIKMLMKFKGK